MTTPSLLLRTPAQSAQAEEKELSVKCLLDTSSVFHDWSQWIGHAG
jgi:hypothetical protein